MKLHAIALLSVMTNTNVTVLLDNLLHSGLTIALKRSTNVVDFSALSSGPVETYSMYGVSIGIMYELLMTIVIQHYGV